MAEFILTLSGIGALAIVLWCFEIIGFLFRFFGIGKKRMYIAGKVGSLPRAEVLKKFAEAEKEVRAMGFVPISPVRLLHAHRRKPGDHLRESVRAMSRCYGVYALEDYAQSPGATSEVKLAAPMFMPVVYQARHRAQLRERQQLPPKAKRWHSFGKCDSCGTAVTPANELPDPFRALYNCGGCGLVVNRKGGTYAAKGRDFIVGPLLFTALKNYKMKNILRRFLFPFVVITLPAAYIPAFFIWVFTGNEIEEIVIEYLEFVEPQ